MKLDHLSRAVRLARRGKYDGAIKLLEPEESRYYSSFNYYYLLAVSYLYAKIYGAAFTYFEQAKRIKMRDSSVLLGMAALYLNHGDTDRAVDLYLEVQEKDDKNRIARKALNIIRKHPGPENMSAWVDSGRLHTLFPPLPPDPAGRRRAVRTVVIVGIIAALGTGIFLNYRKQILQRPRRVNQVELELAQEDQEAPMQLDGSYRYVLTRKESLDNYNEARRLFTTYRDEAARVRLNRILESNSSEPIKNKARLLLSYMEVPGFDTLKDHFTYADVIADPPLYRDCFIVWRGSAANLEVAENHTSFDFLVGYYNDRRTMEGTVRVDFDFAIAVNRERPLEILGRIVPISAEKGMDIRIQGIALNQAALLDQNQNAGSR